MATPKEIIPEIYGNIGMIIPKYKRTVPEKKLTSLLEEPGTSCRCWGQCE